METYGVTVKPFPGGDEEAPLRIAYYTLEITGLHSGAVQILKDANYLESSDVLAYMWKDAVMWGTYATIFASNIISRHRTELAWLQQKLGVLTEQDAPLLMPDSWREHSGTTYHCGLITYLHNPYWLSSGQHVVDEIMKSPGEPLILTTNGLKTVSKSNLAILRYEIITSHTYKVYPHGQGTYRLDDEAWTQAWKAVAEK